MEHMWQGGLDVVAVKAADTLHNARCIALDVRQEGAKVWERFTQGPRPLLDYYRQITQVAREKLSEHSLVDELEDAIEDMVQALAEIGSGDEDPQ